MNNTEPDDMIPKESSLGKTRKIKPKVANTKEVISSVRGDKEYIVEKIVGHKKIKGKYTFEIKWQNHTETSWEDKSYLDKFICDDVNTYLQNLKNKSTDKKKGIRAAETIMTKDKQNCLPKTARIYKLI